MKKNAWTKYSEQEKKEVFQFSEGYKEFLTEHKTEREFVEGAVKLAEAHGFVNLETIIKENGHLYKGSKVYVNNRGKALALFIIGSEPLENGMRILGAHIDSPRLDVKPNPLYENAEFALLDTHYYGGIKKYQWVALPLAIHGVVVKKDGTKLPLHIGENETDPVVGVSDLLIHLASEQLKKNGSNVVEGEDLDIMIGSIPMKGCEKDAVKAAILKLLKEDYHFDEDDFLSAELEVVPAGKARDYGLDRSMILAYGQDDKVCSYISLQAILNMEATDKTCVCLLVDKEEIGSYGATGMQSQFFENAVGELCMLEGNANFLSIHRAMQHSKMLSCDVNAGYDPLYEGVMDKKNASYLGKGIVFNKYTGSRGKSGGSDANAEFIASLRTIMDQANVSYQLAELGKVDAGGGGTIAYILANYNMDVIDSGISVLSMHAPYEVTSKADIYEAYRGYVAFLKDA